MFGDLRGYGLPRAPEGIATTLSRRKKTPVYDDGLVGSVKAGRIEIVPEVAGFDGPDVVLANNTRIAPSAVIAATAIAAGSSHSLGTSASSAKTEFLWSTVGANIHLRRACSSRATGPI